MRLDSTPVVTTDFVLRAKTEVEPNDAGRPTSTAESATHPTSFCGGCTILLISNRPQERPQILQPLVDPPQVVARSVFA